MLDWSLCWHLDIAGQFQSPDLVDPDRDPDELATIASTTVTMLTATYRPPKLSLVDCWDRRF